MWWSKKHNKKGLSEKSLVQACINQDRRAQAQLFEQYQGLVMGLCLRYAGNKQEAEDIFQEAFVCVFTQLGKSQPIKSLGKWIRTLTIRTAINHYHKNKKHKGHLPYEVRELTNTDYEGIMDKLNNDQLVQLINELPKGYRLVFNMAVIDGYGHKEIGELLNISESTSRSQLVRARKYLQQRLQTLGIERYETIS